MKNYSASMDNWTRLYTLIFGVFSVGLVGYLYLVDAPEQPAYVVALVLCIAFGVSYLMVPKIYISEKSIILKNTFTTLDLAVHHISTIDTYPLVRLNVRTFGIGGIFGFFGYFNWGEVWYVTNIYKKVRIVMKTGKVYLISVENPIDFVEQIKKMNQF